MSLLKWIRTAAVAERRAIASMPDRPAPAQCAGPILCYTDGSAIGNGSRGCRGGVGVVFPDHPERNVSEPLAFSPTPTNNRAELTAILRAIEQADAIDPGRTRTLLIKSDSKLCVSTCTSWLAAWKPNGWRKRDGTPAKNPDLLRRLDALMAVRRVRLEHVRAHTGGRDPDSVHNHAADRLANAGAVSAA